MSQAKGTFELIVGPMLSGKTEEMIRRINRYQIANLPTAIFIPEGSRRYGTSRSGLQYEGAIHEVFRTREGIKKIVIETVRGKLNAVGIDEIELFLLRDLIEDSQDRNIPYIATGIRILNDYGVNVIANGLNRNFRGEPFGEIGYLMAMADSITTVKGVCEVCKKEKKTTPSTYTRRMIDNKPARHDDKLIRIGSTDLYQTVCKDHHEIGNRPKTEFEKEIEGSLFL
jgi:thymidine kinase